MGNIITQKSRYCTTIQYCIDFKIFDFNEQTLAGGRH